MGTLQSWRRAYGALKDTTKVGLVRVNSDYADLDVAIVKATNHVERPPKDRHLKKIFFATSATRPRADVAYCKLLQKFSFPAIKQNQKLDGCTKSATCLTSTSEGWRSDT